MYSVPSHIVPQLPPPPIDDMENKENLHGRGLKTYMY